MAHPENEEEQEPRYWTPEQEAERDPDARLHRILDKAEKGLEELAKETRSVSGAELTQLGARAQIEVRIISNGFIMSFSRARLEPRAGMAFPVYRPVPEEVFIAGPSSAGAALADAMENALLLAETLRKMDEFFLAPKPPSPPPTP